MKKDVWDFFPGNRLSTVGLSVGVTSADAPTGLLWTEVIGMFLGQLEFFPAIVGMIRILKDAIAILA
ncbi:MAG: hypothetical protein QNJ46_29795 [Leptolyngbyaceae cyanobacterium MO_188.B28]|nr:hypothetical protein [Leptolyngbyaceae cyanobacterium MO_188.B28]